MKKGYLHFILNAHLPYMYHPGDPHHFEQRWLFESICESYIPLIETIRNAAARGAQPHLTLSLSPPLCAMLADGRLLQGFHSYLLNQIDLARHEVRKNSKDPSLLPLSQWYLDRYQHVLRFFSEDLQGNLITALTSLSAEGLVTVIPSSATHAYLPLLEDLPEALYAQIRGGIEIFRELTGISPSGFWLPECGYTGGLERILKRSGISYSFLDGHGLVFGKPCPSRSVYRPVLGPTGIMWYGRDIQASQLIWSAESGYPAHGAYRDFYDDLVYALSEHEVRRFIHPGMLPITSGIKYRSIRGVQGNGYYDPHSARKQTALHAGHFMNEVSMIIRKVSAAKISKPVITVAFDAELFGHWWYEGCFWLDELFTLAARQKNVSMTTAERIPMQDIPLEMIVPEPSSWGEGGYSETWLNEMNDTLYRTITGTTAGVIALVKEYAPDASPGSATERALDMAVREMLMLQSSDWSFLLSKGISETYVSKRTGVHEERIRQISGMLRDGKIQNAFLDSIVKESGRFARTDHRWLLP